MSKKRKPQKPRNCKNCGEVFVPKRSTKIFCKDSCRDQYHNRRKTDAMAIVEGLKSDLSALVKKYFKIG